MVGRLFQFDERRTSLTTELRAGVVTFLTVAYILAVNSAILANSGGPCTDKDCTEPSEGCRFNPNDAGFQSCLFEVRKSLVAATAISSMVSGVLMGLFANMPLALAPGMGINAYFTYNVVGYLGSGQVSYRAAMAAVFIEGWILIFLALTGARARLIQLVPESLMLGTSGGIGLFLAHVGLQTSNGLGVIAFNPATLVTLGGCPYGERSYMYTIKNTSSVCSLGADGAVMAALGAPSSAYTCEGQWMRSGSLWLGIMGGLVMVVMMIRGVKGAIMWGILMITFISWIPNHSASYLGGASQYEGGPNRLSYFKKVVDVPTVAKTSIAWDFTYIRDGNVWVALLTFLYLNFLDVTGTLFTMASSINQSVPGFVDSSNHFPRQVWAFCVDGGAIVLGSLLGTSPLTVYTESAAGIKAGGRTGLTALVVALLFFVSLFFTPIIASIPPYATGPALVLVGAMMIPTVMKVDWTDLRQAVPCFLTMVIMPLTYSVAYGVVAGIGSHLFIYLSNLVLDLLKALVTRQPMGPILREAIPQAFRAAQDQDQEVSRDIPEVKDIRHYRRGRPRQLELPTTGSNLYMSTVSEYSTESSVGI